MLKINELEATKHTVVATDVSLGETLEGDLRSSDKRSTSENQGWLNIQKNLVALYLREYDRLIELNVGLTTQPILTSSQLLDFCSLVENSSPFQLCTLRGTDVLAASKLTPLSQFLSPSSTLTLNNNVQITTIRGLAPFDKINFSEFLCWKWANSIFDAGASRSTASFDWLFHVVLKPEDNTLPCSSSLLDLPTAIAEESLKDLCHGLMDSPSERKRLVESVLQRTNCKVMILIDGLDKESEHHRMLISSFLSTQYSAAVQLLLLECSSNKGVNHTLGSISSAAAPQSASSLVDIIRTVFPSVSIDSLVDVTIVITNPVAYLHNRQTLLENQGDTTTANNRQQRSNNLNDLISWLNLNPMFFLLAHDIVYIELMIAMWMTAADDTAIMVTEEHATLTDFMQAMIFGPCLFSLKTVYDDSITNASNSNTLRQGLEECETLAFATLFHDNNCRILQVCGDNIVRSLFYSSPCGNCFRHTGVKHFLAARFLAKQISLLSRNSPIIGSSSDMNRESIISFIERYKFDPDLQTFWAHVSGILASCYYDQKTEMLLPVGRASDENVLLPNERSKVDNLQTEQAATAPITADSLELYLCLLLSEPRDLYGVYELELLVRCGEEAKWNFHSHGHSALLSDILKYFAKFILHVASMPKGNHLAAEFDSAKQLSDRGNRLFKFCPHAISKIRYHRSTGLFPILMTQAQIPAWVQWVNDVIDNIVALNAINDAGNWLVNSFFVPVAQSINFASWFLIKREVVDLDEHHPWMIVATVGKKYEACLQWGFAVWNRINIISRIMLAPIIIALLLASLSIQLAVYGVFWWTFAVLPLVLFGALIFFLPMFYAYFSYPSYTRRIESSARFLSHFDLNSEISFSHFSKWLLSNNCKAAECQQALRSLNKRQFSEEILPFVLNTAEQLLVLKDWLIQREAYKFYRDVLDSNSNHKHRKIIDITLHSIFMLNSSLFAAVNRLHQRNLSEEGIGAKRIALIKDFLTKNLSSSVQKAVVKAAIFVIDKIFYHINPAFFKEVYDDMKWKELFQFHFCAACFVCRIYFSKSLQRALLTIVQWQLEGLQKVAFAHEGSLGSSSTTTTATITLLLHFYEKLVGSVDIVNSLQGDAENSTYIRDEKEEEENDENDDEEKGGRGIIRKKKTTVVKSSHPKQEHYNDSDSHNSIVVFNAVHGKNRQSEESDVSFASSIHSKSKRSSSSFQSSFSIVELTKSPPLDSSLAAEQKMNFDMYLNNDDIDAAADDNDENLKPTTTVVQSAETGVAHSVKRDDVTNIAWNNDASSFKSIDNVLAAIDNLSDKQLLTFLDKLRIKDSKIFTAKEHEHIFIWLVDKLYWLSWVRDLNIFVLSGIAVYGPLLFVGVWYYYHDHSHNYGTLFWCLLCLVLLMEILYGLFLIRWDDRRYNKGLAFRCIVSTLYFMALTWVMVAWMMLALSVFFWCFASHGRSTIFSAISDKFFYYIINSQFGPSLSASSVIDRIEKLLWQPAYHMSFLKYYPRSYKYSSMLGWNRVGCLNSATSYHDILGGVLSTLTVGALVRDYSVGSSSSPPSADAFILYKVGAATDVVISDTTSSCCSNNCIRFECSSSSLLMADIRRIRPLPFRVEQSQWSFRAVISRFISSHISIIPPTPFNLNESNSLSFSQDDGSRSNGRAKSVLSELWLMTTSQLQQLQDEQMTSIKLNEEKHERRDSDNRYIVKNKVLDLTQKPKEEEVKGDQVTVSNPLNFI